MPENRRKATPHPRPLCIFCSTNPVSSKEDVWPKWIQRRLPPVPEGTSAVKHGQTIIDLADRPHGLRPRPRELVRSGRKESKKVRVICAMCNNGWMSDLEESAIPIVTELVESNHVILDVRQQATLALWAAKTALMMERTSRSTVTSPDDQYHYVYTQKLPPPGSFISLFQRAGRTLWDAHFLHSAKGILQDGIPTTLLGTVTLSLGQLGFYVYTDYNLPRGFPPMPPFNEDREARLWPLSSGPLIFPPSSPVTDEEYRTAATRAQNLPI
jgi:hypothetical protein